MVYFSKISVLFYNTITHLISTRCCLTNGAETSSSKVLFNKSRNKLAPSLHKYPDLKIISQIQLFGVTKKTLHTCYVKHSILCDENKHQFWPQVSTLHNTTNDKQIITNMCISKSFVYTALIVTPVGYVLYHSESSVIYYYHFHTEHEFLTDFSNKTKCLVTKYNFEHATDLLSISYGDLPAQQHTVLDTVTMLCTSLVCFWQKYTCNI